MSQALELVPASPSEAPEKPPRRRHRATRPRLLTRSSLDSRTGAAKTFDKLASEIEGDLGGHDQLSAIERALVEAFCGAALSLFSLNTKLALGQPVDVSQHAQCVGAMVRVASRLGLSRRARNVSPTVEQYLQHKAAKLREAVES